MSDQQQVIVEEHVEHEWMEDNPVEEVVISHDGGDYYENEEQILDHEIEVDYCEPDHDHYPLLLPIKEGIPLLTMNLPDLMSKTISFTNGEKMIFCFNKRCIRQVAFNGFLYTIENYVLDHSWNSWNCINNDCEGSIRTSPNLQELRVRQDHSPNCVPDDAQIRLRIAVYDLRLMAEFTDLALEILHSGFESRMKNENPDIYPLFPNFETLKYTLEDHRTNKIYRKRFEMQTLRDKQKKMNMTPDEVVITESSSGFVRFKRTKLFPLSICYACGEQLTSNALPSQDQLIAHMLFTHGKQHIIERFEFKDLNLFEQYIREINIYSRYRFRRMGIADENMYFLCSRDDRVNKQGSRRVPKSRQQLHCTAFIRVFDWRVATRKDSTTVTIDYCLEHHNHDDENPSQSNSKEDFIDFYTPEVFIREVEDRRIRTQKLLEEGSSHRIKRPVEMRSYLPSQKTKPAFGSRSMAPPLAAQLASGNTQPFMDACFANPEESISEIRKRLTQPIRTVFPKKTEESSENRQTSPTPSVTVLLSGETSLAVPVSSPTTINLPPSSSVHSQIRVNGLRSQRICERTNFNDIYTYNAVAKIEDACVSFVQKLQNCQSNRVAVAYKDKISAVFRKAAQDPALEANASAEDIEKSWVLQKATRGRPRKLAAGNDADGTEYEEEENDGENNQRNDEDANCSDVNEQGNLLREVKTEEMEITSRSRKRNSEMEKGAMHNEEIPELGESRSGRTRKIPARLIS